MLRCPICLVRHPSTEDCVEPGEEGYITRRLMAAAFSSGHGVCLWCQNIMHLAPGERKTGCPNCGRPWERFEEDDLSVMECKYQ